MNQIKSTKDLLHVHFFRHYFSSIYVYWGTKDRIFFPYMDIERIKRKVCVLTLYQDFFFIERDKKWLDYNQSLNMANLSFKQESLCLMHRLLLLLLFSFHPPPLPDTELKKHNHNVTKCVQEVRLRNFGIIDWKWL